jgi:importin subunit beta-1
LIKFASSEALPVVSNALVVIMERSERLLGMQAQLVGDDDRRNYADLQVAFCAVLTVCIISSGLVGVCGAVIDNELFFLIYQHAIRRLGAEVKPMADRAMTLILRLIQGAGPKSPILDDAFLAVGAMTYGTFFFTS